MAVVVTSIGQHNEIPVAQAVSRRAVIQAAALTAGFGLSPVRADGAHTLQLVERAFTARLHGPVALAQILGMGRPQPGAATNLYYRQFLAYAQPGASFTELEVRLSRSRSAGIAVLKARPNLAITPDDVRRRYGSASWGDVRPELPLFYLSYPRAGGSIAFGFPHGEGTLASAVLNWGSWT